jgi:hypothetical protein
MSEEIMDVANGNENEERTFTLLEKIKKREIDPKSLSPEQRRNLVLILMDQGLSTAQIAQTLKVVDRTIERDKKAIFENNSLTHDPKLTEQMAGQLRHDTETTTQQIISVARLDETPAVVKVDAYHRCFQIRCQLIDKLQSMGFISMASQKIAADITHVFDLEQIQSEVSRLKKIQESAQNNETITQFEGQSPELETQNGN